VSDLELVVRDLALLCTMDETQGDGVLGVRRHAAVAFQGGRVAWIGDSDAAPDAPVVWSLPGAVALPGLVDCHTHAVWAGSRSDEFERRLAGEDYSAILEAGGGILSTVRATRAADDAALVALCAARLHRIAARGVTTVEIKSGYGLTPAHERRLLLAAKEAGEQVGIRVLTTFLGAHTVPAELRGDRAAYVRQVIEEQLPAVADAATFVDVYVDRGAFTVDEGAAILRAGRDAGLMPRIHAEQVTYTGAAAMAAGLGASSADHLERLDDDGVSALAAAGTVAVMLPGAMLYLRDPSPPVPALRDAGVPLAVASDLNPGTSPVHDLLTSATLASVMMRLTVEEALLGITANAGRALRRPDLGRVVPGGPGDLVAFRVAPGEAPTPAALIQHLGGASVAAVVSAGALR